MEDKLTKMETILQKNSIEITRLEKEVLEKKEKMRNVKNAAIAQMQSDLLKIESFRKKHGLNNIVPCGIKMNDTNRIDLMNQEIIILPVCGAKYMFGTLSDEQHYQILGSFPVGENNGLKILDSFESYTDCESAEKCFLSIVWDWNTVYENMLDNVFEQAKAEQEKVLEMLKKKLYVLNIQEGAISPKQINYCA